MTTTTISPTERESAVLLTGDEAVAKAVKLSRVAVVPAYPITLVVTILFGNLFTYIPTFF